MNREYCEHCGAPIVPGERRATGGGFYLPPVVGFDGLSQSQQAYGAEVRALCPLSFTTVAPPWIRKGG